MSKESEDDAGTSSLMETSMMEGEDYYHPEETEQWTDGAVTSQLCRICATTNEYLIPIFDGEGLEHQLGMKIEKHLPIQVKQGDKLPLQVCYQCASTLIAWHDLVIGCVSAEKKLLQLSEQELQKEQESDDNYDDNDTKPAELLRDPLEDLSAPSTSKAEVPVKKPAIRSRLRSKKSEVVIQPKIEVSDAETSEPTERLDEDMYLSPGLNETMIDESCISYSAANVVVLKSKKKTVEASWQPPTRLAPNVAHKPKFACIPCGRRFSRKLTLLQHAKSHAVEPSTCSVCDKMFNNASMLETHMIQHTGIHPHQCHVCQKGFIFKGSLVKHLMTEHEVKTEILGCEVCHKSFATELRLQRHKQTCNDPSANPSDRSLCSICGQSFPWQHMSEHMKNLHGDGPKTHVCQLCGQKFQSAVNYKLHVARHVGVKNFICEVCGASFLEHKRLDEHYASHAREAAGLACSDCGQSYKYMGSLQRHMSEVHGSEGGESQPSFRCECGRSFGSKSGFIQHRQKFHGEAVLEEGSHACMLCDRVFVSKAGQQRHMQKTHQSVVQKPTPSCDMCHMSFSSTRSMRDHLRDHHRVTLAFSCKETDCDKSYSTMQGLRQHEKFFHQRDKNLKYPCEICGKELSQAFTRSQHMTIHTGLMNYSCELCHKSFRLQSSLKEHLLTHTDLMPVECPICSKHFRKKSHLRTHIRTHTGEKPYECDICGRAFAQSGDRNKHRINMHK